MEHYRMLLELLRSMDAKLDKILANQKIEEHLTRMDKKLDELNPSTEVVNSATLRLEEQARKLREARPEPEPENKDLPSGQSPSGSTGCGDEN